MTESTSSNLFLLNIWLNILKLPKMIKFSESLNFPRGNIIPSTAKVPDVTPKISARQAGHF